MLGQVLFMGTYYDIVITSVKDYYETSWLPLARELNKSYRYIDMLDICLGVNQSIQERTALHTFFHGHLLDKEIDTFSDFLGSELSRKLEGQLAHGILNAVLPKEESEKIWQIIQNVQNNTIS